MVADRAGRATMTAAEAAVMRQLLTHLTVDVETGPRTEVYLRRSAPFTRSAPLVEVVAVELAAARRLAKAGLVDVDSGGIAHLTDAGLAAAEKARDEP